MSQDLICLPLSRQIAILKHLKVSMSTYADSRPTTSSVMRSFLDENIGLFRMSLSRHIKKCPVSHSKLNRDSFVNSTRLPLHPISMFSSPLSSDCTLSCC
ncbi:hypothetical protein TNCV_1385241 [Trichonephila clavipes]|nr:hypothetical protein TNCV_1385241 [Trichonephila clavipes]